jgi:mono/diheme cytochrome c family protein
MKTASKILKTIGKWGGIAFSVFLVGLTVTVVVLERRTYDVPMPAITASQDPAVIARGRYLAYGPAHCLDCHGDMSRKADALAGRDVPLSGGLAFELPVGTMRTANITPDPETGIGAVSDGQLARALRYGVGRHGRKLVPFMPFANLSDEDLTAVISFLRAQPPVKNAVVSQEPNLLGHVVLALVIKPEGPTGPIAAKVTPAPTAEYGKYLAHSVANCAGCHTKRDMATGAYVGPMFAGGLEFESKLDPKVKFVTPNLTPDPVTGRITNWNEETFVARFHTGKGAEGTEMPWPSFARMTDNDLTAIYRYLRTLAPVVNDTGPSVSGPAPTVTAAGTALPTTNLAQ